MASHERKQKPKVTLNFRKPTDPDGLAEALASKLTIRPKETPVSSDPTHGALPTQDTRMKAMRSVNASMQSLSDIIRSGWKKSSPDGSTAWKNTDASAKALAAGAAWNLNLLRKASNGDLDVERAALSVLGKLVALDMHESSIEALKGMHPYLCSAPNTSKSPMTPLPLHLLSIPLPSNRLIDTTQLTLILTYLAHALTTLAYTLRLQDFSEFSAILTDPTTTSFFVWSPHFASLPTKHIDSLLTRVYTALTKTCTIQSMPIATLKASGSKTLGVSKVNEMSSSIQNPDALFAIRLYALRCLIHTTPGTVDPDTFWDQTIKFTAAFSKSCSSPELQDSATRMVLSAFDGLASFGEKRQDSNVFLEGKGFVTFCEYWVSFAKQKGDICVLDRIGVLMQKIPSSSAPLFRAPDETNNTGLFKQEINDVVLEGTKLFTSFAQTTATLEVLDGSEDTFRRLRSCIQLIKNSASLPSFLGVETQQGERSGKDSEWTRMAGKVDRALERLRRTALKALESSQLVLLDLRDLIRTLLVACIDVLQNTMPRLSKSALATADSLTRILDSLFVLARTTLDVQDPKTHIPTYEHLERALSILKSSSADASITQGDFNDIGAIDFANYYRCVSGAFYNIAGSLYNASRHGAAVPFLKEACTLGAQALGRKEKNQGFHKGKGKEVEREKDWVQLEGQLYRRWELLAACYLKNGDRKNSYNAFMQCIQAFPFAASGLANQVDNQCPADVFGPSASSSVKQLVTIVDRVSYIGVCELFLPAEEVSLRRQPSPTKHAINPKIVGVLIERQYDSLLPSGWKEGTRTTLVQLLQDMVNIYGAGNGTTEVLMPVRLARVLIRCLEFLYRDGGEAGLSSLGLTSPEDIGRQVLALLQRKHLGHDASLARYIPQYNASTHLWLALHAHRRADPNQISLISQHVNDANQVLKHLLGSPEAVKKLSTSPKASKGRRAASPRIAKVASPRATRSTRPRIPAAPRKAPATSRKTTTAPKTSALVTPKAPPRVALQPVSFNTTRTPPRLSTDMNSSGSCLIFDNFDIFTDLLHLTARIMSLLSLTLPKIQMLVLTKRLSQRQRGTNDEGFITASIDLAHEYLKLGKLRRASSTFNTVLDVVRNGGLLPEVCARYLLRFAESLAFINDIPRSSALYLEALEIAQSIEGEGKGMSSLQRIEARSKRLELAAMAANVFSIIQYAKEDVTASLDGMLQSLRLWNRALEAISRSGRPPPKATHQASSSNPFEVSDLKEALSTIAAGSQPTADPDSKTHVNRSAMGGLEWRISEGLCMILFDLSQMYLTRGSAREAEYFLRQLQDLATSLNLPTITSRALMKKAEIQLSLGQVDAAQTTLTEAAGGLHNATGIETADYQRLFANYNEKLTLFEDAKRNNFKTLQILETIDGDFRQFENLMFGPRKSLDPSSGAPADVIVPELLGMVLCRCIWLLRDDVDEHSNVHMQKLVSLPFSSRTKAEENSLLANLTLHNVYNRFRSDMFLSSLTESTIAIPMGMSSKSPLPSTLPVHDVLNALDSAENLLQENLTLTAKTGNVIQARNAAVSLALVKAFQTSLGKLGNGESIYTASLLDASSAITLRREMLEAIHQKLSTVRHVDDLEWPLVTADGTPQARPTKPALKRFNLQSDDSYCDEVSAGDLEDEKPIREYWTSIRDRYRSQLWDATYLSSSQTKDLPSNWTIIHVNVTEDKSTLLLSRQECGKSVAEPVLFCVPLKGRRDNGTGEEEEHLGFDDALKELTEIVRLSDDGTKMAVHIKSDDEEARSNWWKQRNELDVRMKELLENIEFCWLGAFKTILSPCPDITAEMLSDLRTQFDKVFQRSLHVKDKKIRVKQGNHKKTASQSQTPSQVTLDDAMLKCFSTLSPKCRDEELEDLIYFILDLYQFHGVPVAIAEVDALQVVLDLRTVLEEHTAKLLKRQNTKKTANGRSKAPNRNSDEHIFLVLDKNVQGIPWESIPILRGRSVSRIPSIDFLQDRVSFAKMKHQQQRNGDQASQGSFERGGMPVDPRNGFFILNPSGDLGRTEGRFRNWVDGMKTMGWDGIVGELVSEQQFVSALKNRDLVVYFGHGGGEQYVRSHKIKSLTTCAVTMLWGCSSGALRDMGDFDRVGTPYSYMLAGCPTLIANLWDVTDRDIDKFSMSVFDKLGMSGDQEQKKQPRPLTSVVTAVAQSRESCKLKYLTGAAPVVYGIPFYL